MTDHAYGYYELNLFDGAIKLPLKFCTSYAGEDTLRASAPIKSGVNGRTTNRIYVLAKEGHDKIESIDDIEKVIKWGTWTTYMNVGTSTKPVLEEISKFEGLSELLEKDKERSKERTITMNGIHPLNKLKIKQYNGRHFHCAPHTAKCRDSEKHHNIYRVLAEYLKKTESFVLCTFFSKGEELGALYEEDGILRMSGLYADKDLKSVQNLMKFDVSDAFREIAHQKFSKLRNESDLELKLEWRDYVSEILESKGLIKNKFSNKVVNVSEEHDKNLIDLFNKI